MEENQKGLVKDEIARRRQQYGYNEIPEKVDNIWWLWLRQFWGPLPWLLEITAVLTYLTGSISEAVIILLLVVFNGTISIIQRSRTTKALAELRQTLQIFVRVFRNLKWQEIAARELLPGDLVRLRAGDIVAADMQIMRGNLSVDQSTITGESLPKELNDNGMVFSGSSVLRGEASAIVVAIGANTKYGVTVELLQTVHPPTHMESVIFTIIKYQFIFNLSLVVVITIITFSLHWPVHNLLLLIVVLLISSVPVAFPAMFTIAQTYGALQMAHIKNKKGILVRRLSAVQDGAMMNVLCTDKTGTLTQNKLSVVGVVAYSGFSQSDVISMATGCSNVADQDPIDGALFDYAKTAHIDTPKPQSFTPFDPSTKKTMAKIVWQNKVWTVLKGQPATIAEASQAKVSDLQRDIDEFSRHGYRTIAIAAGHTETLQLVGLVALADPVREDSKSLLKELMNLGIAIKMITGDNLETAQSVAAQLGLPGLVCRASQLANHPDWIENYDVFAEAYPEDKQIIVKTLQQAGYTVAMTGDGVNDAPALHQAEVGIAVANATDIAKNSASFILTNPGLEDIVQAVKMSRQVYNRIRTWAINKIIKSFEVAIFTVVTFLIIKNIFLTPFFLVLILLINDFVTISIATDNAVADKRPAVWQVGRLMISAGIIAISPLTCLAVGTIGVDVGMHLKFASIQSFSFMLLILLGLTTLFAIRSWPNFWQLRPSRTLLIATMTGAVILLIMAVNGILIPQLSLPVIALIILLALINLFVVNRLKLYTPSRSLPAV